MWFIFLHIRSCSNKSMKRYSWWWTNTKFIQFAYLMKTVHFLVHLSFCFKFFYAWRYCSGFYYRFSCTFFSYFFITMRHTSIHSNAKRWKEKKLKNYFNSSQLKSWRLLLLYYGKLSEARECRRQSGGRRLMQRKFHFSFS